MMAKLLEIIKVHLTNATDGFAFELPRETLLPTETIDFGLLETLFVGEGMIMRSKLLQNEEIKEVSAKEQYIRKLSRKQKPVQQCHTINDMDSETSEIKFDLKSAYVRSITFAEKRSCEVKTSDPEICQRPKGDIGKFGRIKIR